MFKTIDSYIESFYNSLAAHPKLALLFVALILAVWLAGIAMNWKWTYERGSFWANIVHYMFPESVYRVIVGISVAIALAACMILLLLY